ncbi:general secretion pathway protein GspK [Blastopirellula marina]|uniref:General secretion pathway protein GspK n=1 Tax=Blastopirellula marina TaxID=124 RepID=A0A2S8EZU5_9BACT|nr:MULTISPECIES: type II secretion system protein GspK [Pirellulaceae]PQO25433.1 general secretion pathway protein GspK [Blastopirellula marina]RCS42397.1 general secretion pathway protein GspK [Bremerella cremea]
MSTSRQTFRSKRGAVLFVVLVVVMMITLSAYAYTELMFIENKATHLTGRQIQARNVAESGIAMLNVFLEQEQELIDEQGGIYDNPDIMRGILVYPDDTAESRGRFSVLAPALNADGSIEGIRFGLEDESSRVNLNALLMLESQTEGSGRTLLMALPGMNEEIADCILDYIDEDDEPRELGAEFDYYNTLDPPYNPKNAPLETVEELLLVRGVTPELLFGRDTNRNGLVDDHEWAPPADGDRQAMEMLELVPDLGWSSYLTLVSMEKNYSNTGQPKIYLNEENLQTLHDNITAIFPVEYADFICAYRLYGGSGSSNQGSGGNSGSGGSSSGSGGGGSVSLDLSQQGQTKINNVLELIGASVQVQQGNRTVNMQSPFEDSVIAMNVYLPSMMDNMTINPSPVIPGRININQAPYEVLLGIPGMDEEIAGQILEQRLPVPDPEDPVTRHETWILLRGIVTTQQMISLSPFVCGGGDVYRAQVVGYFEDGSAFSRQEVVIDATQPQPKVMLWRDISELGRGHPLEVLGVELGIDDGQIN